MVRLLLLKQPNQTNQTNQPNKITTEPTIHAENDGWKRNQEGILIQKDRPSNRSNQPHNQPSTQKTMDGRRRNQEGILILILIQMIDQAIDQLIDQAIDQNNIKIRTNHPRRKTMDGTLILLIQRTSKGKSCKTTDRPSKRSNKIFTFTLLC